MSPDQIAQRLNNVPLVPQVRGALLRMVDQDHRTSRCEPHWSSLISHIDQLLRDGDTTNIEPFAVAWATLYAVLRRLDHLEDSDPVQPPMPSTSSVAASYNLVFTYYLVATSLLDDLSTDVLPARRILRLRRMWTDLLLSAACGQQRDLELNEPEETNLAMLDRYQEIAKAKTGAIFALAFGGTATLATDDPVLISTLTFAGEVYGLLLQYSDDLLDESLDRNKIFTLPAAYSTARAGFGTGPVSGELRAFWQYIYTIYVNRVEAALAPLAPPVRSGIRQLFTTAFERRPDVRHGDGCPQP